MKQKLEANTRKHQREYEEYLRQEEQIDTAQVYSHANTATSSSLQHQGSGGYAHLSSNEPNGSGMQAPVQQNQQNFEKSQASYVI